MLFDELTARGCYCMLTNHNTELINELYSNKGYRIDVISVKRIDVYKRQIDDRSYKKECQEKGHALDVLMNLFFHEDFYADGI